MGAAASIEGQKPADASDILASESLEVARGEVVRLRTSLGHLAKKHPGFDVIVTDASDLCHGDGDQVRPTLPSSYVLRPLCCVIRPTFLRHFISHPCPLPRPCPNTPLNHLPSTIDIDLHVPIQEDFKRCVAEVVHIRAALRLSTQSARRQTRAIASNNVFGFGSDMGAAAALAAQGYQGRPMVGIDYATDSGSSSDDDGGSGDGRSDGERENAAAAEGGCLDVSGRDAEEEKKEEAVNEAAAATAFVYNTLAAAVVDM